MVVLSEELSKGNATYELSVRDEVTGYYGAWFCRTCWLGGVNYELTPAIADALEWARAAAIEHHDATHRHPPPA